MSRKISICLLICMILVSIQISDVSYAQQSDRFKTFIQTDPEWSGNQYVSGNSMGNYGCAITSIAILMAYANSDLRDPTKWNPWVAAQKLTFTPGGGIYWGSVSNADSSFMLVSNDSKSFKDEDSASKYIKDLLDEGYYVIIRAEGVYGSGNGHYSPIVGYADGKPLVWDVAGGGYTWDRWVDCGISQVVVYSSTKKKSSIALKESIDSSKRDSVLSDDLKEASDSIIEEWKLIGLPENLPLGENQEDIHLADRQGLSQAEITELELLKENIEASKKPTSSWFYSISVFLGMLLIAYSMLLFIGALVDRLNNWVEVSCIRWLTMGRCTIVEKDEAVVDRKEKGYFYLSEWVFRCIFLSLIGIGLLSGLFLRVIVKIIIYVGGIVL